MLRDRMSNLRVLPLLTLLVLAGCGSSGSSDKKAEATATAPAATATATTSQPASGCQKVARPKPKADGKLSKPSLKVDAGKTYTALVKTSCGEFTIKLDTKRAPKTSASFVSLARKKFFDHLTFHRIVPGFVIQGGDPLGTGLGGPGYSVTEAPPKSLAYTRGVVAMAKGGAEPSGASGSQFFVVTGDSAQLPPDYALLGTIGKGQDVVDTIGTTPTDPTTEMPVDPVVIDSVTISEK